RAYLDWICKPDKFNRLHDGAYGSGRRVPSAADKEVARELDEALADVRREDEAKRKAEMESLERAAAESRRQTAERERQWWERERARQDAKAQQDTLGAAFGTEIHQVDRRADHVA